MAAASPSVWVGRHRRDGVLTHCDCLLWQFAQPANSVTTPATDGFRHHACGKPPKVGHPTVAEAETWSRSIFRVWESRLQSN